MELPQRIDITSGAPLELASIVFHSCFFFLLARPTSPKRRDCLCMWSIISRIVTTNGPRTSLLQSGWLTAMFLKLRSGEGRFWTYWSRGFAFQIKVAS